MSHREHRARPTESTEAALPHLVPAPCSLLPAPWLQPYQQAVFSAYTRLVGPETRAGASLWLSVRLKTLLRPPSGLIKSSERVRINPCGFYAPVFIEEEWTWDQVFPHSPAAPEPPAAP